MFDVICFSPVVQYEIRCILKGLGSTPEDVLWLAPLDEQCRRRGRARRAPPRPDGGGGAPSIIIISSIICFSSSSSSSSSSIVISIINYSLLLHINYMLYLVVVLYNLYKYKLYYECIINKYYYVIRASASGLLVCPSGARRPGESVCGPAAATGLSASTLC